MAGMVSVKKQSKTERLISIMATKGLPLRAAWQEAGFDSYVSAYNTMERPSARQRLQAARGLALTTSDLPRIAQEQLRGLLTSEDTPAHVRLRAVELVMRETHGINAGTLAAAIEREKELHEMNAAELAATAAAGMEALQSIAASLKGQTIDTSGTITAVRDVSGASDDLSFMD